MKKSIKKILLCGFISAITLSSSLISFAGTWKQDNIGWWWQEDNGSYPANTWQWIDDNNDGNAECYYFNSDGYLLISTTTPDGYQVNENGAWITNSVIQTQKTEVHASANQNINANGHQMYFNHPKWTKEEVLAIKTADDFKKRFYWGEYAPKEMLVITSQATSDKHAQYLDQNYDYANYLSSAYAYGLDKDVYMIVNIGTSNALPSASVVKSTDLYEASKEKYNWNSFDDFYIYNMMIQSHNSPYRCSIYATTDNAWKRLLEDMIDNIARWEGQEVPNIFLMHDRSYNDYVLTRPEALYKSYEELLDYYQKEGTLEATSNYKWLKSNEKDGYNWIEPTQFFKLNGGWSSTPYISLVNSWLEAMKPTLKAKYGVEISWHIPSQTLGLFSGMSIWLTPVE